MCAFFRGTFRSYGASIPGRCLYKHPIPTGFDGPSKHLHALLEKAPAAMSVR